MGNETCCQQIHAQQLKSELVLEPAESPESHVSENSRQQKQSIPQIIQITKPFLSQQIEKILVKHRPFQNEFNAQQNIKIKKYGDDIYEGPVDLINRPSKLGRMFYHNGAYFIGYFVSGKAEGPCFYVMKDGSYFSGSMKNNQADCPEGSFVSKNFQYTGGFKNNVFEGKGQEKSPAFHYSFEGTFSNGLKKNGIMKWRESQFEYIYEGDFDQNGKFGGQGKLFGPEGFYDGQFLDGKKHGYGVYNYKNQLRYEGYYANDKKQGQGKLFNNDGSVAYKGVFKNGMPNGKGIATTTNGIEFETEWVDGIDFRML